MSASGDTAEILDEEELLKKHRQEKKDLQSRIQSLKKSVPKGDKKKKKEVSEEIAKLEQDFNERVEKELKEIRNTSSTESSLDTSANLNETVDINNEIANSEESNDLDESKDSTAENTRVSRAQRRRNKKANEEKEREKRISEQSEKNKTGARNVEINQIKEKLREMNLKIYEIEADGNCLYCAIIHQLRSQGRKQFRVSELRKITADFMRNHKDEFLPFMYNENDDGTVSEEQFEKYCKDVAHTKLWGGQLELRALSSILDSPIKVIQANGPPTILGETATGQEIILTYHRPLLP